ncbi:hypothetical protein OG763_43080 [Streptomyces sp. NBC_01230]|uniref:hypothetical protein n=1 Tax=unclassified Streptomyces TaxID=2593676 RepID=UPI002E11D0B4|nr:hypothetical protein OG763_00110 [Streptomyces sp. NBC_01230]WSQ32052.1 hypothetical protein OG763_43080 [Streptomyces sp. NBC_01230]
MRLDEPLDGHTRQLQSLGVAVDELPPRTGHPDLTFRLWKTRSLATICPITRIA